MNRRKEISMRKVIYLAMTILSLIFILNSTASALDVSLTWDASPSLDVAGYKLYYQAGSASLPLDGTDAPQGSSPIDIGNNTSFLITNLSEKQVYYFAVTAYDTAGYESAYSNILASSWVPPLIAPSDGSSGQIGTATTFNWETAPVDFDVTYTLYYGTDSQLTAFTPPLTSEGPNSTPQQVFILLLLVLFGLIFVTREETKSALTAGAVTLALGLSLAGCGGGGSSGTGIDPLPGVAGTVVVATGTDNYYVALDLEPATNYYWKVVANDQTPAGLRFESMTYHFTTAAN